MLEHVDNYSAWVDLQRRHNVSCDDKR